MESPMRLDPHVYQKFRSKDGKALNSLPTQLCIESDARYLLWNEVQSAFKDVNHLEVSGSRILFMIDEIGEL